MLEVRRSDDGSWHVSATTEGVYIRTPRDEIGTILRTKDAVAIARAILEVTEDVHL